MATVQEPLGRTERAVVAMLREGLPITARGIVAYLKRTEGVGCSLREATVAARAHREAQAPELMKLRERWQSVVIRFINPQEPDLAARMVKELKRIDWASVLDPTLRTRAGQRRRRPRGK